MTCVEFVYHKTNRRQIPPIHWCVLFRFEALRKKVCSGCRRWKQICKYMARYNDV